MQTFDSKPAGRTRSPRLPALIGALLIGLAGCGGGGGGGDGGTTIAPPPPPPPPPPPFVGLSSEAGSARIYAIDLGIMANGDGVAVWEVETTAREVLRYSVYTAATDSWGPDLELAVTDDDTTINYALAEGDDAIAVIYGDRDAVYASLFQNGQFGAPQLLDETDGDEQYLGEFEVASTGSGFAAAWISSEGYDDSLGYSPERVRASVLATGSASFSAATDLTAAADVRGHAIASNGDSYLVAVRFPEQLAINYYFGAAWLPQPATVEDGLSSDYGAPVLATNGDSYLLDVALWRPATDGALLDAPEEAERALRAVAHLILSLPEAQLH